ncbi:MAG TPA: riboflavin synthase [Solirubrobacteraceae bacterium]|nr:riboflavin synthase [Solirubrobacteraceae bacterium]
MFTGLVAALGSISGIERSRNGVRVTVTADGIASELHEGDSVAVNGVCLTAVGVGDRWFTAEVMNETLARSSLHAAAVGMPVNLELPLRASDRLGGHVVQGHVDGVGSIDELVDDGFAVRVRVSAPAAVLRYVVEKGSIAIDGVSLTVAAVDRDSFTVSLIPETLQRTNLGSAKPGTTVNLEVDLFAKYVEKLLR